MENRKIIAFYLPQYHPIPENDAWWGKGFTEWTNVGKAKPLYKGHYQPKVPTYLGYYDLRVPEVREAQANLAKEAGISGFCYWHYWFEGKQLMEMPLQEVIKTHKPDYPFCVCWANHSWYAKNWNIQDAKRVNKLLIKQTYGGEKDYIAHFESLLPAFKDSRYIKNNNKPIFGIYNAIDIPQLEKMINLWNQLAKKNGFDGIYFFAYIDSTSKLEKFNHQLFNEIVIDLLPDVAKTTKGIHSFFRKVMIKINAEKFLHLNKIPYQKYHKYCIHFFTKHPEYSACIIPNYDHSPRSGKAAIILEDTNPQAWEKLLKDILQTKSKDNSTLFIKAWNEWGEGNYLEPDIKYGNGFITSTKKAITQCSH